MQKRRFLCRLPALLLALALLGALMAGCGKQNLFATGDGADSSATVQSTPQAAPAAPLVYRAEPLEFAGREWYGIDTMVMAQGRLWSVGGSRSEDGSVKYQLVSLAQNEDGTVETACVPLQLPEVPVPEKTASLADRMVFAHYTLFSGPDGTLYSLDWYYGLDEEKEQIVDGTYSYFLSRLQTDGQLTDTRLLEEIPPNLMIADTPQLVGDTLYLVVLDMTERTGLPAAVAADGSFRTFSLPDIPEEVRRKCPEPEKVYAYAQALQPLADGRLLVQVSMNHVMASEVSQVQLCIWDTADNTFGDWLPVTGLAADIPLYQMTSGADGTCWLWGADGVYHLDPETGAATLAGRWRDAGIEPDTLVALQPLEDGGFLASVREIPSSEVLSEKDIPMLEHYLLYPAEAAAPEDRTVVTVGLSESAGPLHDYIDTFNRFAPDIYIQTKEYDTGDVDATVEAIAADILNNTMPDILLLSNGMNLDNYVRKGVFLDLYPYLDADEELARADFAPCMLAACEYDGTLPFCMPGFSVCTLSGPAVLVGETAGWTPQQLLALQQRQNCETPILHATRDTVLTWLTLLGDDTLIDFKAGSCALDSEVFVRLLEASAAYPADYDQLPADPIKEQVARGDGFLVQENLYSFYNLRGAQYIYNGPATYIGFPNADGRCGAQLGRDLQVGITYTCQNPDAAWKFVRTLFLADGQRALTQAGNESQYLFPARMELLQQLAEAAKQSQPVGTRKNVPGYLFWGMAPEAALATCVTEEDDELWTRPLTDEEVEQFLRLFREVDSFYNWHDVVADILAEEAAYYYNGQRSAEEAAEIIQNRVQTYLDEQG